MAWSNVQALASATTTTTTTAKAFAANVTAGNILTCSAQSQGGTVSSLSVADNQGVGNVWNVSPLFNITAGFTVYVVNAWCIAQATSSTPPTVTASGFVSGSGGEIAIAEFTPPSGSIGFDGTASGQQGTTGQPTNIPGPGTGASDLLLGNCACGGTPSAWSSPWVKLISANSNIFGYAINVAGNEQSTVTMTSANWGIQIAAVGVPASANTFVPRRMPFGA